MNSTPDDLRRMMAAAFLEPGETRDVTVRILSSSRPAAEVSELASATVGLLVASQDALPGILDDFEAVKRAARAMLDAFPRCKCMDDPTADVDLCRFTPHHHDEIKALEALL